MVNLPMTGEATSGSLPELDLEVRLPLQQRAMARRSCLMPQILRDMSVFP